MTSQRLGLPPVHLDGGEKQNLHQMKASWHADGAIWMRVIDRHDQLLGT
jgi:hypothetical protein